MADPYSRYGSTVEGGNVSRLDFLGYLPSQAPSLASHFGPGSADMQGASSGVLNADINSLQPREYCLGGIPSAGVHSDPSVGVSAAAGIRGYSSFEHKLQSGGYGLVLVGVPSAGGHPEPSLADVSAAASIRGYSPLEDPNLVGHRDDASAGINPVLPDITNESPSPVKNVDGPSATGGQSNTLSVDGLPTDCTRREVGLETELWFSALWNSLTLSVR